MKNEMRAQIKNRHVASVDLRRGMVASEVRACIARRGLSRADMEAATGIGRATLSRKLHAKAAFTVDELIQVATVLDVEPSIFFPKEQAA